MIFRDFIDLLHMRLEAAKKVNKPINEVLLTTVREAHESFVKEADSTEDVVDVLKDNEVLF